MKQKSLSRNALLNGIRGTLNIIFPLITFPYVSRVLSIDGMGIYNFSNTYVNYFLLIAGLGVATYAVREGAKYRDDQVKIKQFASQVFTINIISTVVAYILLLLSLLIFHNLHNYVSTILIFSLQLFFTTIGTEWIYTIYEEYSYITIRSIVFEILSIILLFTIVKKPSDYLWYAGITVFASVGANVLNFVHARKYCQISLTKNINVKYHLKPILIIFASAVAVSLYVSSDTTILGLLKGDHDVGVYSIAVKIYSIAQSLLSSILVVTIPRLAMLLGKRLVKQYNSVLSKLINILSVLVLPVSTCLIMLSEEAVLLLAGKKYLEAVNSLRIITWAIIFSIFSWILNQCVLIPAKREKYSLRNTVITGICNVILNFILIPFMSYDGTSLSTVIAEFMVMVLNAICCWDIIKKIVLSKMVIKDFLTSIIGCVGIAGVCFVVKMFIVNLSLRTIISIMISIFIYIIILLFLKNKAMIYLINKFKIQKKTS